MIRCACSSLGLSTVVAATAAGAQTAPRDQEIVVTGQRFEEQSKFVADQVATADTPSKDTPFSVTAITHDLYRTMADADLVGGRLVEERRTSDLADRALEGLYLAAVKAGEAAA